MNKMNKKKWAVIIVLIVAVIVVVGVIGFNNRAKAPEVSNMPGSTSTAASGTSTPTSTPTSSANASSGISIVVSTSTQKNYAGASFSFTYPGAWTILSASPLLMTNFSGQYKANGVIPAGGVQMTVVTTTISGNSNDIMAAELANAIDLTTSTVTVDGTACAKATYQVNYAPGATVQNVSVYCSRGNTLWKIYLSYPANDPAGNADVSEFNTVLASMKLSG